mmetsp:Transcript_16465/g.22508  ORF Transcript_16465/g.22508 Transcript_16465/m.22508 type:complete len:112 (-) Transcript_16465:50-385(-)
MSEFGDRRFYIGSLKMPQPRSYLCRATCPEHCLFYFYRSGSQSPDKLVVGAEVKGLDASIESCYSQLISVCGNGAISLLESGVSLEDAVVPGILFEAFPHLDFGAPHQHTA